MMNYQRFAFLKQFILIIFLSTSWWYVFLFFYSFFVVFVFFCLFLFAIHSICFWFLEW